MAAPSRTTDRDVKATANVPVASAAQPLDQLLFAEPYRFDFFQAVRLLERIYDERQPVGGAVDPSSEVARFRTRVSLAFPPSEIHDLDEESRDDPARPPQMTVAFMGLTGPLGVLPVHYTELLIERTRNKDTALWEFLDLFNHRLISLFYRAWEKYRFPVAYERGEEDRFTEYLFDAIGMGTRGLRGRQSFADQALVYYGGLVAARPHSAGAIAAMLSDYFDLPAEVAQFSGQWLDLDEASVTRLGEANSELGRTTMVGARVWDNQSKFRLRFGPLDMPTFLALLPGGSAYKPAAEMTRLLAGLEFDFDLQLVLKAEQVPACILTTYARRKPMLGWTTWLKTQPFAEDDGQVVLSIKD
jgi:type VI secretion system protein ImpH